MRFFASFLTNEVHGCGLHTQTLIFVNIRGECVMLRNNVGAVCSGVRENLRHAFLRRWNRVQRTYDDRTLREVNKYLR
jgi:hypothetical protein